MARGSVTGPSAATDRRFSRAARTVSPPRLARSHMASCAGSWLTRANRNIVKKTVAGAAPAVVDAA